MAIEATEIKEGNTVSLPEVQFPIVEKVGECVLCADRTCQEVPPNGILRGRLEMNYFHGVRVIKWGGSKDGCETRQAIFQRYRKEGKAILEEPAANLKDGNRLPKVV